MAIELSTITFTEQADIVPVSGAEEILNTGIANTLAGNDIIIGTKEIIIDTPPQNIIFSSIFNSGTLNTADGNDIITGTLSQIEDSPTEYFYSRYSIYKIGTINTGNGDDKITGINEAVFGFATGFENGIYTKESIIDTGNGNDIITGTTQIGGGISSLNSIINTGDGDDIITGSTQRGGAGIYSSNSIINAGDGNDSITATSLDSYGLTIISTGGIDTGKGNDIITGTASLYGVFNYFDTFLNTSEGNDIITGNGTKFGFALANFGFMDTGDGNDIITGSNIDEADGILDAFGTGLLNGGEFDGFMYTDDGNDTITGIATAENGLGIHNLMTYTMDTGNGNDIIAGTGSFSGILNSGTINTGNGEDSIISHGKFTNYGGMFLGDSNDSIITDADLHDRALENYNAIETGEGNDTITSTGVIYNQGVIETGNGDDSIIVNSSGAGYGIHNFGGAINMGDGNDTITANEGFESGENSSGAWFLGEGEDYIKGFGSGDFYGGSGNDTLELTPGTYTVGIWGEGGESPIFTKGDQLMITSEFESLIAGSTIYDFATLTAGQIIIVA